MLKVKRCKNPSFGSPGEPGHWHPCWWNTANILYSLYGSTVFNKWYCTQTTQYIKSCTLPVTVHTQLCHCQMQK